MPEQFGRYEIMGSLAVGGMAEIFLAKSDAIGGLPAGMCAIKRIRDNYSSDLQFVSMFIDEARITIGLDHDEHRAPVRLRPVSTGTYYMAMEYVDGTRPRRP